MLFSLVYFLVRRLLAAGGRRPDQKDSELLVLRHQVKVLQRQVKRPRRNRLDRVLLAAASRAMTRSSWSSFVMKPETLLPLASGTRQEEVDTEEVGTLAGHRSIPKAETSSSASAGKTHAGGSSGSAGS